MLEIKPAAVAEIPVIQSIAFDIWPKTYAHILTPEQSAYMLEMMYSNAALQKQVQQQGHRFIIAYFNQKPVAFASYGADKNEAGLYKLHKIYILAEMQGHGVGKQMISAIINLILPLGARWLELNVNRNNQAKLFYEKLGFVIVREEDNDIGNHYFMNDYVMRKTL